MRGNSRRRSATVLGLAWLCTVASIAEAAPIAVEVVQHQGGFRLLRGGQPYVVKGAGVVGMDFKTLAQRGGNSVRTWGIESAGRDLDEAARHGLTVALGLPVASERFGMDYGDEDQVAAQRQRVREAVERYREHPALLAWIVGNELNHGMKDPRVYDEVNELSKMIHALDPNHPTTTTITAGLEPLAVVKRRAPDLDFISIQLYGALPLMPRYANEWLAEQPFMVTEWGPLGHWEAQHTAWGAPVEMDSSEKARRYRDDYRQFIEPEIAGPDGGGQCLGSYVFLWGQKQERTPTWYSLFSPAGASTAAVDAMQLAWSGQLPANQAPVVAAMQLDGQDGHADITLTAGQVYRAELTVHDPEGDALTYRWQLKPESTATQEGGDYEAPIESIPERIDNPYSAAPSLRAPKPGTYRLFAYAFDGKGHMAHANIPFRTAIPFRTRGP